jgi:hypothetical protein
MTTQPSRLYVTAERPDIPRVRGARWSCAQAHRQSVGRVSGLLYAARFCGDHMLFIVGLVMVLIAVVVISGMRLPGGVNSANLGWMSEQWLAEHRASHST